MAFIGTSLAVSFLFVLAETASTYINHEMSY